MGAFGPGCQRAAVGASEGGDLGELGSEPVGKVVQTGRQMDVQGLLAVHAAAERQLAEHPLGVIREVVVDPRPATVDVDVAGRLPPGGVGVATRVAAPEDQQIGERVGAGGPAVSAGR